MMEIMSNWKCADRIDNASVQIGVMVWCGVSAANKSYSRDMINIDRVPYFQNVVLIGKERKW